MLKKYTGIILKSAALILLMSFVTVAKTQDVSFYATADAKEVLEGSKVKVTFTLENAKGTGFRPPQFKGFDILSGPSISSSSFLINGISTSKNSYTYVLMAQKPGVYTIGPASIKVGNRVLHTQPLKIKVIKRKWGKKNNEKKYFATMEISDTVAYPGQQITLKYKLYASGDVSNYSFRREDQYDGFLAIELETDDPVVREIVDNTEYYVYTLKTLALFPQKEGTFTIAPAYMVLQIPLNYRRNVFFRSTKSYPVHTESKTVTVLPLPPGAPPTFSGNTGKFDIAISTDKTKVSTDDAFSLKIQLTSDNPAKFIQAPKISNVLPDFEIYDPQLTGQREYIKGDKLYSKKIFSYLVVPKKAGTFQLKIPYTYFDPDSAAYVTTYSNVITMHITQGKNKNVNKKNILDKYKLRPLKTVTSLKRHPSSPVEKPLFLILLGLIFFSIIPLYMYKKHLEKINKLDPRTKRKLKAGKEAMKRLKKAKLLLKENDTKAFYKEISDALLKYISDKLNIPAIELTKSNVESKMKQLGLNKELIDTYLDLLEKCEIALYTPGAKSDMDTVYKQTKDILTRMEMELSRKEKS